jgi:diguanylate cyclase (GGDEF)-like protein
MTPAELLAPVEFSEEVSTLIEVLHQTVDRLEELTSGEVDSVLDRGGRTFLLQRAQDRLRFDEAAKQAAILNGLPAHIALLDTHGVIVAVNEAWKRFDGGHVCQRPGYEIGHNYVETCAGIEASPEAQHIAAGIRSVLSGVHARFSIEYPCHSATAQRWFLLTVTPLASDRPNGAIVMHSDITQEMLVKGELSLLALQTTHSAEHDFLTGLPNRMLLNDRINQAIGLARRHGTCVAVLFLDLDGFKHINDSLGHSVGDLLLQSIAKRLLDCVRDSDTVSRQGGDEFVVLLAEMRQHGDAATMANKLLCAVAEPHTVGERELHVTTSIGVSVYPDDGVDGEALIGSADTAMYQAKENGSQTFRFFTPAMNARAVERQFLQESLRRALERREFVLHYQPKFNLKTGAIVGAEALLRWTHPIRGPISPASFISVAEDCGLIVPIGAWVLRHACEQARAWVKSGLAATTMAVNVSAIEFRGENFLQGLFEILRDTGLDPKSLELELTETVLMKRVEYTTGILQKLRRIGVQVAIDDFGTGYSSLSYLRKFPLDTLKIDRSFVQQIGSGDDTAIVTAIISMAHSLNLKVIAEGVETLPELEFLQAQQCDEAQGYYFSRPLPALEFAKLLDSGIATDPNAVL